MRELAARYWGSFFFAACVCLVLQVAARGPARPQSSQANARFSTFQLNYLMVFLLAMFSDWLQGPYVYELYVSYGFSQSEIAELFVGGYASSLLVGTFVGGLADKLGRRNMCIAYAVCYILSCCTKTVPHYGTLLVGRFLSGVATSLLFSAFESWMVCEHFKLGFDPALLGDTFAYATFGNGLVAVCAGLVANSAAAAYGFCAPFVLAIVPLTVVAILVTLFWSENYGNQQQNLLSSLSKAYGLIRNDSRIFALGLAQSCFEGAMYTFVFMWTPALKSAEERAWEQAAVKSAVAGGGDGGEGMPGREGEAAPETTAQYLGLVFAVFMVCTMVGSSIFKLLSAQRDALYKIPIALHGTALLAMAAISVCLDNKSVVYAMFLVFETCVGLFYPSYGMIKSERIPEDIRSSVMSIFRVPLNVFVVLLLLKIKYLSSRIVFTVCTAAHSVSLLAYLYFYLHTRSVSGGGNGAGDVRLEDDAERSGGSVKTNH